MGQLYNVLLATFAATGSFLFGYDAGVMTDVIASPNFLHYFQTTSSSSFVGAVNSTFSGGAVVGSLMGGLTMDRFGRKQTIQIASVFAILGAIIQCSAVNMVMILAGRIISGLAIGLCSMAIPVYQAECADPTVRGKIVGLTQQMVGIGFIVSTWIGFGCHHAPDTSSVQWRFPLAFQIIPSVVLLVGLFWLPETPRWLIENMKDHQALQVLHRLHYNGKNADWIEWQFNEIKSAIKAENEIAAKGWRMMFRASQWRNRLLHGTLVQVFTQLTGINVIGYYQTIMYQALGFTGNKNVLVAGLYNCVGPIANFIFIFFILDRVGRRKPLIFGALGISATLISEAVLNSLNPDGTRLGLSIAGVIFLFLVSIIFSFSFGPISWLYTSEIMPMPIRGRGNAFAIGVGNWLVATVFAQVSPVALEKLDWKYYICFAAFNLVITLPTVYFFFKETNQKSLEEIDLLFGDGGVIAARSQEKGENLNELSRQGDVRRNSVEADHIDFRAPGIG
ncbi:MFS glucose transporter mfs1 [Acrodontium crateriforme]|uniref:MFS glucose transporter mfs1 n=1 Tax=Acrodontium crateriforme TaxID=150365 RepID=A0AAQ3M7I3_9PEZI|nr:MFS glucose transporter mfs1 [Acrodontium crateriforme]